MNFKVLLCFFGFIAYSGGQNTEVNLREVLLNSSIHNRFVIPRKNASEPVEVTFTWLSGNIGGLDEKAGTFSTTGSAIFQWKDEFLQWNPNDYGGIESVVLNGAEVWTPTITVLNRINSDFLRYGLRGDLVRVNSNGDVSAVHSEILTVICSPDPEQFPYDCQSCSLLFGSEVYNSNEVILRFSSNPVISSNADSFKHPLWDIEKFKTRNIAPPGSGSYAFIEVFLHRKPLYYSFTLIIPSSILCVLIIATFFIPNDEGEKISCGMTILLSFVVFLVQIDDVLPENSNAVSVIARYYMMCMTSSVVMIINVIILSFLEKRTSSKDKEDISCTVSVSDDSLEKGVSIPEHQKLNKKRLTQKLTSLLTVVNIFKVFTFLLSISLLAAANITLLQTSNNTICKD